MKESNVFYFDPRRIEIVRKSLGNKEGRFNPRTLSNPGWSPEKMESLRNGIAKDGLNHSLLVRVDWRGDVPESIKLVAGERRLRAVLGLVEADEDALGRIQKGEKDVKRVLVKNPKTKKVEPALDVYGKGVECKVSDEKDEKEILRQAVQENTLHEQLTEHELLLQCDEMEKAGFTRSEQAKTMDMSEAWISQSHSLLKANPCILRHMERGQLTRTAALTFLNVPDDKVEATLKRAVDLTYKEAEEKELSAQAELAKAKDELQMSESALRLSQFTGNHESAKRARRQVARASKTIEKAEQKLTSAQVKKKKKITVETINKAATDVDAADNLNRPQSMKQVRLISEEIGDLLKSTDGVLANPETGDEYSREHMEIVHGVLEWVLNRNTHKHPLEVVPCKKTKKRRKVAA